MSSLSSPSVGTPNLKFDLNNPGSQTDFLAQLTEIGNGLSPDNYEERFKLLNALVDICQLYKNTPRAVANSDESNKTTAFLRQYETSYKTVTAALATFRRDHPLETGKHKNHKQTPRTWTRLFTELTLGAVAVGGALYLINQYYPLRNLMPDNINLPASLQLTSKPQSKAITGAAIRPPAPAKQRMESVSLSVPKTTSQQKPFNLINRENIDWQSIADHTVESNPASLPSADSTILEAKTKPKIEQPVVQTVNTSYINELKNTITASATAFVSETVPPLLPGVILSSGYYYFKASHKKDRLEQMKTMMPMVAGTAVITGMLLRAQPDSSAGTQKGLALTAAAYVASEAANKTRNYIQGTVIPTITSFTNRHETALKIALISGLALGTFAYFGPKEELTTPLAASLAVGYLGSQAITAVSESNENQKTLTEAQKSTSWTDIGSGAAAALTPIVAPLGKSALEATKLYPHDLMNKLPNVQGIAISAIDATTSALAATQSAIINLPYKKIGLIGLAGAVILGGGFLAYRRWKEKNTPIILPPDWESAHQNLTQNQKTDANIDANANIDALDSFFNLSSGSKQKTD